jgi:HK97 family phage major capsid protein
MKIDSKGLATLMAEASVLANRSKLTGQEEKRYALLLSQISLLKTGEVTLADLTLEEVNETERRAGLPVTQRVAPVSEARATAEAWQTAIKVAREDRAVENTEGNIIARIGTFSGLGSFVPTQFMQETYAAMAAHDAFLDEEAVTVLNSTNGRVTEIPTYGDIENVASVVGESANSTSSEAAISAPGHAAIAAYSYRSPLWRLSVEAMQDIEAMNDAVNLFRAFASDRIARGVAADLVSGDGISKPLGIVPALLNAGVTPVSAVGAADNTGDSGNTAANSIGSKDIANLYYSVNKAYRNSPKAAFFMSDDTLVYLAQLVNKMGNPLVQWQGPEAYIFGKPVRISPSMDSISASSYPVLFGDGSYWMTRKVVNDDTYVQVVKEAAGLAEKGLVALRMFARFDGTLLWSDVDSPAPFALLQMHS